MAEIRLVPCMSDNYAVLMHDAESGTTLLVDAPEAEPIADALDQEGWTLTHILITHKHHDHIRGLAELKARDSAVALGPAAEAAQIPGLDREIADGETVEIGPWRIEAIATPGHTAGPLSYVVAGEKVAFTGDSLFAMGCGRLFEGDAATMWRSLLKLREKCPDDTRIYCGHEYTLKNAEYAHAALPDHKPIAERLEEVKAARAAGEPTVPTLMGREKATNPFLLADEPSVAAALGMSGAPPEEVFAKLRKGRDTF
jgi:hydroxyacylglutathione hydrolase